MFTLKGEKMESILEIKNVTKIFGKKQKQALEIMIPVFNIKSDNIC
jgi:hypothetical protein